MLGQHVVRWICLAAYEHEETVLEVVTCGQHLEGLSGGLFDGKEPAHVAILPGTSLLLTPLLPHPSERLIQIVTVLKPDVTFMPEPSP